MYGVNTGFGALAETRISPRDVQTLQHNLLRSHSCGVGSPLATDAVRAMMLLRANVLALGHSGVRPVVVETLLMMLDRGVHPVIPSQGSVGASGDLAPLAHLALVLIGEGKAEHRGETVDGAEAMHRAGITPLALEAKEGLALINGTQFMLAVGGARARTTRSRSRRTPTSPEPCRSKRSRARGTPSKSASSRRVRTPAHSRAR